MREPSNQRPDPSTKRWRSNRTPDPDSWEGEPLDLEAIPTFFLSEEPPSSEGDDSLSPADLRLAACAILIELACADDVMSGPKWCQLLPTIQRWFDMDEKEAQCLLEKAQELKREATDLWPMTVSLAEHCCLRRKLRVLKAMWEVALSDGTLSKREAYLMQKISGLMALDPELLDKARSAVEAQGDSGSGPASDVIG